MKLRELAAGCAVLLGIDDGFLREGGVMTEDEQLVYERLKSALNSVYTFIAKDYCRPLYTEVITTDAKSGVLISELSKSYMQFHSAKNEKGCPVAGREYPDYVRFSVRPGQQGERNVLLSSAPPGGFGRRGGVARKGCGC